MRTFSVTKKKITLTQRKFLPKNEKKKQTKQNKTKQRKKKWEFGIGIFFYSHPSSLIPHPSVVYLSGKKKKKKKGGIEEDSCRFPSRNTLRATGTAATSGRRSTSEGYTARFLGFSSLPMHRSADLPRTWNSIASGILVSRSFKSGLVHKAGAFDFFPPR